MRLRSHCKKIVIYINEQDTVEIDNPTLPYLKRAMLHRFIKGAINSCQVAPNQTYDEEVDWLIKQHLEDERRLNLTEEEFADIKKGIYCVKCASFAIEMKGNHFHCQNSHFGEAKEKAIVRTIYDYSLLFPYRNLNIVELIVFIGPNISRKYLYAILVNHFNKNNSRNSILTLNFL